MFPTFTTDHRAWLIDRTVMLEQNNASSQPSQLSIPVVTPTTSLSPNTTAGTASLPASTPTRVFSSSSITTAPKSEADAIKQRILSQYAAPANSDSSSNKSESDEDDDEEPSIPWARTYIRIITASPPAERDKLNKRLAELKNRYFFKQPDAEGVQAEAARDAGYSFFGTLVKHDA